MSENILRQYNDEVVEYDTFLQDLYIEYPEVPPDYFKLNEMQFAFIRHYAETFNALESARKAGYSSSSEKALSVRAWSLLKNPKILFWIREFVKQCAMPADVVLARLASIATGSLEDFITIYDGGTIMFDLKKAEERGVLHLIKRLRYIKSGVGKGGVEIELHDPLRALELIGKHLGMWDDAAVKINDYTIKVVREGDGNE